MADETDAATATPTAYDRAQDARLAKLEATVFGTPTPVPAPPPAPTPAPGPSPTPPGFPALKVAVVNEATVVNGPQVAAWVEALKIQAGHVATHWMGPVAQVRLAASIHDVAADEVPLVNLDNSDQAHALGYHDVTPATKAFPHGRPYGRSFAATCMQNGVDPASCLSHEFVEILGDPEVDQWVPGPKAGQSYAVELADPVESTSYWITPDGHPTIEVSDFVLPAYFAPSTSPVVISYSGLRAVPGTVQPGGYQIVRNASGKETEITADIIVGDDYPAWRQDSKLFEAARTLRRLA